MNWKELITDKDFLFNRISTLIILIIGSSLALMQIVIPFIKSYFPQPVVHIFIFVIVELLIISSWYYYRAIFPKGNKNKLNLVIAITTEDKKQKTRITKDLTKEINKQLRLHGLSESYAVITLHNHLSKILNAKIDLWAEARKAQLDEAEDIKKFNKITKRLNAKFFVYGDLIKRNSTNSTYYLSIEALILHAPTNQINSQSLHNEFSALWKREIMFLEDDELNGFKSNAEHIFFTASYMLGLATLVDNKFEQGIKIWDALLKYVEKNEELKEYKSKITQLKGIFCFLFARMLYFQGEIEKSVFYREQFLAITPNEYDQHLNEAIKQVKLRNDPELALEFVNKSSLLSNGDGTWRYSKLYLQIRLGRCEDALQTLDEIISIEFTNEIDTIHQVISYNNQCLKEDANHIQSNFIIGSLIYKKLNRPLDAYEKLEDFANSVNVDDSKLPLKTRALSYISEINKIIRIEN
jgi:hypothetical protein